MTINKLKFLKLVHYYGVSLSFSFLVCSIICLPPSTCLGCFLQAAVELTVVATLEEYIINGLIPV